MKQDQRISEMNPQDLAKRARQASELLAQARALFPGLVTLSVEDRRTSNGKMGHGEPAAMRNLLVAAGKHPAMFVALADKDRGPNDALFEPEPTISDLDRIDALTQLADEAEAFAQSLSDTLLEFGSSARDVTSPVLKIINANKTVAPSLASDAAQGLEFYASRARAAARAKAKGKGNDAISAAK